MGTVVDRLSFLLDEACDHIAASDAELARLRDENTRLRAALAEIVQVDRNGIGDVLARRRMAEIAAAGLDSPPPAP
jgi:hypothetical protein